MSLPQLHRPVEDHSARTGQARPAPTSPLEHIHEHPEIDAADVDIIRRLSWTNPRVLDIGAGRGGFVAAALERGIAAIGLDAEPTATSFWSRRNLPGVLARSPELPFAAMSFEVIRLKEVIEHLPEPLTTMQSVARILAPGGYVLAHVPSTYSQYYPIGNFWDDYTHVRPFSRFGLVRLMEDAGLTVVLIDGYVAGRSRAERVLGKLLARVLPHTYRVLAKKSGNDERSHA